MNELQIKQEKAKKMMLWVGMISMSMTFAGLTSAYVVSSTRADWLSKFDLPSAFTISTFLIATSSLTFFLAKQAVNNGNKKRTKLLILSTLGSVSYTHLTLPTKRIV